MAMDVASRWARSIRYTPSDWWKMESCLRDLLATFGAEIALPDQAALQSAYDEPIDVSRASGSELVSGSPDVVVVVVVEAASRATQTDDDDDESR